MHITLTDCHAGMTGQLHDCKCIGTRLTSVVRLPLRESLPRSLALNHLCTDSSLQARGLCVRRSGVRTAIDGEIRSGDVRRFRARDERYQRGDLVDSSVTALRRGSLLRCCPIARGGIQGCVDRARLDVIDRDARSPTSRDSPWVNINE
jgi:hypothetical protein